MTLSQSWEDILIKADGRRHYQKNSFFYCKRQKGSYLCHEWRWADDGDRSSDTYIISTVIIRHCFEISEVREWRIPLISTSACQLEEVNSWLTEHHDLVLFRNINFFVSWIKYIAVWFYLLVLVCQFPAPTPIVQGSCSCPSDESAVHRLCVPAAHMGEVHSLLT